MRLIKSFFLSLFFIAAAVTLNPLAHAAKPFKLDVKEFRLKNNMLFLVVERHVTPQVACRVAIRAGSALDQSGKTGNAHMLEHLLFKGTKNFGSLDYQKDQELQEKIESAYQVVLEEQHKRSPNRETIKAKLAEMEALRQEVQEIYVPQAFSTQLSRNGAVNINAFTSPDQTQYFMSVPADMIEQWFSMVSEQLFEPAFREFYVEKEVIKREWAYRYVNNPGGAAWLDLQSLAFTAHPYRNPTIGWESDIAEFNTWDALAFHQKYYNPNNAVCVLVGDISLEKAKEMAEAYFGRYINGNPARETVTNEPEQHGPRTSIHVLQGARKPLIRVGFHGAPIGTRDFYALDVLSMLFSYGHSARFSQNLINNGLAQEAWAHNPDNRYAGLFVLGGSPVEPDELKKPDLAPGEKYQAYVKACQNLEDLLIKEIEKVKTGSISEQELKKIKKLNFRDTFENIRSNEELAQLLATLEVEVGWQYFLDYAEKIESVTSQEIKQAAVKYLDPLHRNTAYIIPGDADQKPVEPYEEIREVKDSHTVKFAPGSSPSVNFSIYPTPPEWKHPLSFRRKPKRIQYPQADIIHIGNTPVFYLSDHELPLIYLTLLFKTGAVDLPDRQTGLAELFERCLVRGGTKDLSPKELADFMDENAIHLSVAVQEEQTSVSLSMLKEDWDKGLKLMEETLTRPGFDQQLLEISKKQILTELKRGGGEAMAVAGREALIWHFKGHPYGRDPLLGLTTLPNLGRQDLQQFLETYFTPANMVVAVAGDIDRVKLIADLQNMLQSFPKGQPPSRKIDPPQESPPVLALIHKPGQIQSEIIMTLPGLKRTHPDYWKLNLLVNILGGEESLLTRRLREDLGLVYAGSFSQTFKWQAGFLVGYLGCKNDRTADAVQETVKILARLQAEVPAEDLEQKRLDELNGFVFNVDTPEALVNAYSRYDLRGEPLDTLDKIQTAYMTTTKKELEALAKKVLDPRKLQIFIVTDKALPIKRGDGQETTLELELRNLAEKLNLPFLEILLR